MGVPDLFDYLLTKLEGNDSNKVCEKNYRTDEAYETYLPKIITKSPYLFYILFGTFLLL